MNTFANGAAKRIKSPAKTLNSARVNAWDRAGKRGNQDIANVAVKSSMSNLVMLTAFAPANAMTRTARKRQKKGVKFAVKLSRQPSIKAMIDSAPVNAGAIAPRLAYGSRAKIAGNNFISALLILIIHISVLENVASNIKDLPQLNKC